jgi:hypothetical protein
VPQHQGWLLEQQLAALQVLQWQVLQVQVLQLHVLGCLQPQV